MFLTRNSLLQSILDVLKVPFESFADKAYNEGRTYRLNLELSLPSIGDEVYLKYVSTGDVDLTLSTIACNSGSIEYEVFTAAQASGESGITTAVPVYPRNMKSDAPVRASHLTITRNEPPGSGTLTLTGTSNSKVIVKTDKKDLTVYGDDSRRGFGASTVYVRVRALQNGGNDIILDQEWIEYD